MPSTRRVTSAPDFSWHLLGMGSSSTTTESKLFRLFYFPPSAILIVFSANTGFGAQSSPPSWALKLQRHFTSFSLTKNLLLAIPLRKCCPTCSLSRTCGSSSNWIIVRSWRPPETQSPQLSNLLSGTCAWWTGSSWDCMCLPYGQIYNFLTY